MKDDPPVSAVDDVLVVPLGVDTELVYIAIASGFLERHEAEPMSPGEEPGMVPHRPDIGRDDQEPLLLQV